MKEKKKAILFYVFTEEMNWVCDKGQKKSASFVISKSAEYYSKADRLYNPGQGQAVPVQQKWTKFS